MLVTVLREKGLPVRGRTHPVGSTVELSRRDAKAMIRIGWARATEVPAPTLPTYQTRHLEAARPVERAPAVDSALADAREEYASVLGKRPWHGWDVDTLRQKIAEAGEG